MDPLFQRKNGKVSEKFKGREERMPGRILEQGK